MLGCSMSHGGIGKISRRHFCAIHRRQLEPLFTMTHVLQITDAMIEAASEAYAAHRDPQRWDGPPWGEAGQMNHRKAIKAALEAGLKTEQFVLQITDGYLCDYYLKGPRSPADVRKYGYSFTNNIAEAWMFATSGEASRKRHAVARHMSWTLDKLYIATSSYMHIIV
jgi:hypothetical protein